MNKSYHIVVIGGGCLGAACAFSVQRRLGNKSGRVAVVENKVLGAGLSSRHSAIVCSANASPTAARMAKIATQYWKNLRPLWGVSIPNQQPGAIRIAENAGGSGGENWAELERLLQGEGIDFAMISHRDVMALSRQALTTAPDEICYHEPYVLHYLECGRY